MLRVDREVPRMEDTIIEFLIQLQDGKAADAFVALIQATLTGQRLITDGQLLEGNHVNLRIPLNLRRLQSATGLSALVISVEVVLARLVNLEGADLDLIEDMNDNMAEFVRLVRDAFGLTNLFEAQTWKEGKDPPATAGAFVDNAFVDQDSGIIRDDSRPRLALLWSALTLASVSAFSAALLHVVRWRRNVGVSYAPSVARATSSFDDNSNTTSTHPAKSSNRNYTTQAEERGEGMAGIDNRSAFRRWKLSTAKGVVSGGSASRWNTFSWSRSLPGTHGGTPAKSWRSHSLLDLLDPHGFEDIWSVAPDDDLCKSVNGSSRCDENLGEGDESSRPTQDSKEYDKEVDGVVISQGPQEDKEA
jgi:hypothetical protein